MYITSSAQSSILQSDSCRSGACKYFEAIFPLPVFLMCVLTLHYRLGNSEKRLEAVRAGVRAISVSGEHLLQLV